MNEHLLNIREAAEYLGIGERKVKELVDSDKIPAYKIGGVFLRFKKSQLAIFKTTLEGRTKKDMLDEDAEPSRTRLEDLKDFLYFNDFYILSIIIIVIAVVLMSAT